MSGNIKLFTTLIRTHHITSRKKLQRVKKAAAQCKLSFVLVRSGGPPGIMYAEGPDEKGVSDWVSAVRNLRYKMFKCEHSPAANQVRLVDQAKPSVFEEVTSVAEFGERMNQRGLDAWWRSGMNYNASSD
ncbi:hypothetical protein F4779DRAFT_59590 [Xylariaceae sp. FL0662B]|nr:hypothetical protein F4779DRAFT_59590 [Xylariaceae sp. FL0662B]